jgi:hypothetical protein
MTKYKIGDRVVVGDRLRSFPLRTLGTVIGFKDVITFDILNACAVVEIDNTHCTETINEDYLDPIPASWLLT